MHQQGGTIENALRRIESHEYVLPAIQREFVWQPEQVCNLFDSLMQGYPFGEFMLWRVNPENADLYRWYDFVREYHQRDNPHCPELAPIHGRPVTAVLDGQQRLTAFNIGLRGSMARKLPYKRWNSWDAFPRKILALDLLAESDPDEEGNRYTFEFIDEDHVGLNRNNLWFKVGDILGMESGPSMSDWIHDHGLDREQHSQAYSTLDRLHRAIRVDNSVAYYEELSQDIERVLSIFIRCNSGGTPLSYSNLLLSIAVSQWKNLDARREVHGLVDEMNRVREGLLFNADFVLKAGLMLTDIASVGFRVENFTRENTASLEEKWQNIRHALLETVELVDSFGFDSRTLQATNSLLPIAYYLYRRGAPRDFEVSDRYIGDRRVIRGWLTRSILKESGIWGSGPRHPADCIAGNHTEQRRKRVPRRKPQAGHGTARQDSRLRQRGNRGPGRHKGWGPADLPAPDPVVSRHRFPRRVRRRPRVPQEQVHSRTSEERQHRGRTDRGVHREERTNSKPATARSDSQQREAGHPTCRMAGHTLPDGTGQIELLRASPAGRRSQRDQWVHGLLRGTEREPEGGKSAG